MKSEPLSHVVHGTRLPRPSGRCFTIFEFGFSDSLLQMWAAFLHELAHRKPLKHFAGCVTPEETALSHRVFTAALESQRQSSTVALDEKGR